MAMVAPYPTIGPQADTAEFIGWTLDRFQGQTMVLTTQFGMEGCALIDMYAAHGRPLTVVYLDTMFLFPETYALRDRLATRYSGLRFENRGTTLTSDAQEELHGPNLWHRDPNLCCRIRKVDPMRGALAGADIWISAITREQSAARADTPLIGWDWQFGLLKISPLVAWDRKRVWQYIQSHEVPHNPLHHQGYPSIGCTHCTQPVPGADLAQYTRLGRWNGDKVECGLHINGSGI